MDFNPLSPEFKANPYAFYQMLQTHMPVFHMEAWNLWFCFRYADCNAALRDPRLGHEFRNALTEEERAAWQPMQPSERQNPLWAMQRNWMLVRDVPDHTRLRTLVHKAFTPRMVERLREPIESITLDLLNRAKAQGAFDVVADLAYPLPVTVIAELLGVPTADHPQFSEWSRAIVSSLDLTDQESVYNEAADATVAMDAYMRALIAERRKAPREDLISALAAVEEQGDRLTEAELVSTLILLLAAGHETTVNLIGSGVLALLRHPDQFAKLKADPSLTRNAVEEMLRYDSPVQLTSRLVQADDVMIGGQHIPRKTQVAFVLGAANRDPEKFTNPELFDITRPNANQHIGFGGGIHFCLGAPLARLEGEIALRLLVQHMPDLRLSDAPPRYRPTYVLRGLESLPAHF